MIAQPSRQQLHSYHLVLSILVLILTIYPYLFNNVHYAVAAYSADDFSLKHDLIDRFDIIEGSSILWQRSISTRETDEQLLHDEKGAINTEKETFTRKLRFHSLGRTFDLVLAKPAHLVTQDFTVISLDADGKQSVVPYNRDDINILDGFIDGETKSKVTASFNKQDKLLTAQIKTGHETIIVEPTYLHQASLHYISSNSSDVIDSNPKLYNETMIIYNLQDHKQFNLNSISNETLFDPNELCAALDISNNRTNPATDINSKEVLNSDIEDVFKIYESPSLNHRKRSRRGIEVIENQGKDKTRCTLHLVADYLFYKHVGKGDFQTTINYLLALVNRVNKIYLPTIWETGDDSVEEITNIGFTVHNITIHQEYTRVSSSNDHYNMQSDKTWGAREFLDNFSQNSPAEHYCLAHLLTYRQFDSPVLGLAYVASTRFGTIGGICSPTQREGDLIKRHNTGISTSRGIYGETLITRQADLVLAHELAHNFGAEHDSNECRPSPSEGGAYLMHPFAVMGFEENNRYLSNCSRLSIGRVLRRKASTCFVGVVDNVCGNGIVEKGEDCDGGGVGHSHRDPCCDMSCRFTPGSQCSDRHSWCCSKCRIQSAGVACRPAEEYNCKQAASCDGNSPECPESPPPVPDDTVCVGRGLCRGGDCKPFCEAKELHSCLCNNPRDACKLCCKTTPNSTCVPFDSSSPHLPDGVLCYRGVCEKGRCEQPIQDVVERLWDVIEDVNFTTFVKFLRDNIILVVLVVTIPLWCLVVHFINRFDKRVKDDVMAAIAKRNRDRKKEPPYPSPFLPRLFVGDDTTNPGEEIHLKNGDSSIDIENFANVTSV